MSDYEPLDISQHLNGGVASGVCNQGFCTPKEGSGKGNLAAASKFAMESLLQHFGY